MPTVENRSIALKYLVADPEVQRGLDARRVDRMATDFDSSAVGAITVSARGGTMYHIIDGQHRVAAARLAKGDDWKIPARMFTGLTIEKEAELFRLLNNTAKVGALDLFRVRVVEGEKTATYISDMLGRHGFKVGPTAFAAVAAAERIYNRDPMALERTLAIIVRAWGRSGSAIDGRIVEGIGLVFVRYGDAVDFDSLGHKLASASDAASLLGRARSFREMLNKSSSMVSAVAEIVVETYNKNRRTQALPAWRSN